MFRVFAIAVVAMGLVSCGEATPSIEGKWAWVSVANCEGDIDTVEFLGTDFTHRLRGEVRRVGRDMAYQRTDVDGAQRVTAIYIVEGPQTSQTVAISFDINGEDGLIYRGSTIDGVAPPAAATIAGRELFRCQ